MELIKVVNNENNEQVVDARELYDFLELDKSQWSRWYRKNIEQDIFFEESRDYKALDIKSNGNTTKNFLLKVNMAKELSMLVRNLKGKQAREYFIECEKKLKEVALSSYQIEDPIKRAKVWILEQEERLLLERELTQQQPQIKYYKEVLDSGDSFTVTQISKEAEMSARQLNIILVQEGVQFKQSGQYQLKSKYQDKGYAKVRTHTYTRRDGSAGTKHITTFTEKGREFILDLLLDI